jgi:HSP20 family protein
MPPPRRSKDVKGLRAIKGASSLSRSGQSTESKNIQRELEKGTLTKVLEQLEHQKARIENKLSEIMQATQREVTHLEEPQESEKLEKSSVPEIDASQDEKGEKKEDLKEEINVRIGKFSLGDLVQGIGSVIDFVSKMEEEGKGEARREGELTSPSGRAKVIYGFSVKEGLGGTPVVEPFGNVKKTVHGPVVEEEREPLVDVFDEKDHVAVIAELPGIQLKAIHTEIQGDILTLSAANGGHKYYKEVVLPENIDANTVKTKYRNGVLEIRINKK